MKREPLTLFHFPGVYPIGAGSFKLPGLGRSGPTCGVNRMSHFSSDGSKVKYSPLSCGRIECPKCWPDWARRMVFNLAFKIEAYARAHNERPKTCVFSVAPDRVNYEAWTWERVSRGLFRRGYRRAKNVGVDGGVAIFHPYRIRPGIKRELKRSGEHREVGMWKLIRARVNAGEALDKFVSVGPHVHSIIFGEPRAHVSKDFLIAFADGGEALPKELETARDLVYFLFYLITHTGVLTHLKEYSNGKIHRRATHTVRAFGSMHRWICTLPPGEYEALAREIAGLVGMEWHDGELSYPASSKEFGTSDENIEWVPIYKLGAYLNNEQWLTALSNSQCTYWLKVLKFMKIEDRPPNLGESEPDLMHPGDVEVYTVDIAAIE
jgi:hypothetical protein